MKYLFTVLAMLLAAASWSAYAGELPDDLHFKCFFIEDGDTPKKNGYPVFVDLEDQFKKQNKVKVNKPTLLCAPVKKCVRDPSYPNKPCYDFTDANTDGKHLKCHIIYGPKPNNNKDDVILDDQFNDYDKVKVRNAHFLCTPADKKHDEPNS